MDLAAPIVPRVPHDRALSVLEKPVGVLGGYARPLGDREGRHPQSRLEAAAMDLVAEPAVAMRELVVRLPITGRPLIAVVELHVAEEAPVEVGGAEFHVGDHVRLGHPPGQLVPRAPSGRHGRRGEALAVHRRDRREQEVEGLQPVAARVIAEPQRGGVALGAQRARGQPLAHGLEPGVRQLDLALAGVPGVERERVAARAAREPDGAAALGLVPGGAGGDRLDARRGPGIGAVDEREQGAAARHEILLRGMKKSHPPHGGQHAVGIERERDGRAGGLGVSQGKEFCFQHDARRAAAHDYRLAARRPPRSDSAILQIGERDKRVSDPGADLGVADERDRAGLAGVPQGPAVSLVELEPQAPHAQRPTPRRWGGRRRGLGLRRCRLWVRSPDGSRYAPITTPGDEAERPGYASPTAPWLRGGPHREPTPGGSILYLPLSHEEETLGALEVIIPQGRYEQMAHDVIVVAAKILAPMIAGMELSQDLASEVALRTREVEAQRSFAARIIDSLPVGLYVIDRSYHIRAWNRKRETGTEGVAREDAVGREVFEGLDRQPRELLKREFDRVFDTGEIQEVEVETQTPGGPRHYRITKVPMRGDADDISHVITIGEDVTEWRRAQQRLAETEKLAAVGQLAAGVMHEINNPLATILACTEALGLRTETLPPPERGKMAEYLKIIDTEIQRCRRIVESLLEFSRPKGGQMRPVDLNEVVEQTLFVLKLHSGFTRVGVVRKLARGLPPVRADAERLIQSFMALMLNAMDAMDPRGTLTVRSRVNPEREDELLLEFLDTGSGIRKEDLSKIFEPFYTTKPQGRGTGLGLSICYGIVVAEHGGRIEVESDVGVGSNFKVYLPLG